MSILNRLWAGVLACLAIGALALPVTSAAEGPDSSPAQQIIVKYRDGVRARAELPQSFAAAAASRGVALQYFRTTATNADVLRVTGARLDERALAALAAVLARDPAVEYAEVDAVLQPFLTPDDTRYNEQWHYYETTGGIGLPTAWNTATGTNAVVAVIDTGYRPHVDLAANLLAGYDFITDTARANDGGGRDADAQDPGDWVTAGQCYTGSPARNSSWHGTHVAGTVAAVSNNANGVAGVAFNARVVPVRVLGRCGGTLSDIADGIIWASGGTVSGVPANANTASILNLSLGGAAASCSATLQTAINGARSRGAALVVSAGNDNTSAGGFQPANCSGVITVASTDRSGGKAYYSNYGSAVDLAAPGGETNVSIGDGVLSTLNTGATVPSIDTYAFYQGTSMAAPHVSGVAALVRSVSGALTPDQMEAVLKNTARAFPASCSGCGTGIVDAPAAIAGAMPPAAPSSLSAPLGGSPSYSVTWQHPGGYSYFKLEEANYDPAFTSPVVYQVSTLYKSFSNKPSGEYWYRAQACNAAGVCSAYSNKKLKLVCNPQCN